MLGIGSTSATLMLILLDISSLLPLSKVLSRGSSIGILQQGVMLALVLKDPMSEMILADGIPQSFILNPCAIQYFSIIAEFGPLYHQYG